MELDLGEVTCVLKHVGGDHAHDSVVMYIKRRKDIVCRRLYICRYFFLRSGTIRRKRTFKLIDELEKFDAETYILSHGEAINREEFLQEIRMLKAVGTYTEAHKGDEER